MTDAATNRTEPFAFVRDLASRWDIIAIIVVIGLLTFVAEASRGLLAPVSKITGEALSLDPIHLPVYAARTTLRMFTALGVLAALHLHLRAPGRPRARAPRRC